MCANIRPHVLQKIEKALNEMAYHDAILNSSQYNNRLVLDRKTRMPFIDAQTGVAQRDCSLWMQKWERMPGTVAGQLYTYPSRRWKKKRRGYLLTDNYFFKRSRAHDSQETSNHANANGHLDTSLKSESSENIEKIVENVTKNESKDAWIYAEYDDSFDFEADFEDPESDYDDSEEFSIGRKKKRKEKTPKKKKGDHGDVEKPYICDICDARYKTRPGLTYHYSHSHRNSSDNEKNSKSIPEDDDSRQGKSSTERASSSNSNSTNNASNSSGNHVKNTQESNQSELEVAKDADAKPISPSPYCDFCLGDSEENKKSKSAEQLISCSDCGRSAHPTCLQFTPQMIIAIQKYKWQCIECKSCGVCGTSDNDDQLLFCDDCDRGYHMYCLRPPLSEPPEGSWSCHLCSEESQAKKKAES